MKKRVTLGKGLKHQTSVKTLFCHVVSQNKKTGKRNVTHTTQQDSAMFAELNDASDHSLFAG